MSNIIIGWLSLFGLVLFIMSIGGVLGWHFRKFFVEMKDPIRCRFFGHHPVNVNTGKRTADCHFCNALLDVSYDMTYGETVIVKVLEQGSERDGV
jgi:hypothetical protein